MKDSDLTKLARWVIPGWIGILSFIVFVVVDIFSEEIPHNQTTIFTAAKLFSGYFSDSTVGAIATTLLIAASGVPLGFSIYQAYFFLRWNSPFSRYGLSTLITGRMNDLKRTVRGIPDEQLVLDDEWRRDWVDHPLFNLDHGFKWRYIELLFTEAAQSIDAKFKTASLYERHRYLHEVTHTLGASIGAVYFGFASYYLTKLVLKDIDFPSSLSVIGISIILLFVLMHKENLAKQDFELQDPNSLPADIDEEKQLSAFSFSIDNSKFYIFNPSFIFVFAFTEFVFLWHPEISANASEIKYSTFLVVAFLWFIAKRRESKSNYQGDILLILVAIVTILFVSSIIINLGIDLSVPFLSSLATFLIANIILFKNRQNATDDMLALEYYVFQRYLNEENQMDENPKEPYL